LHHGTLNAIFLPAVVAFNAQADSVQRERKLQRMARVMGLSHADDVPAALRALTERLGLPTRLSQVGVQPAQFERIIDGALADHCHKTNPRLATRDDYRALLQASW
ncbi:MAG: iron-containing alcohol dehydrogenase, partial [Tepidimonas sp.]|nr:iron-containing alcohol dehydrogenase [Tepidimonas sp.]